MGEMIKNVDAEGACAIYGMSDQQAQLVALQRARAAAIEQAAGVMVTSSTLVTNFVLRADFIKTYSKGFIVKEKVQWLVPSYYQKDPSTAPILEYRVKINADIFVPKIKIPLIGLDAKANSSVYKSGENAFLEVKTDREVKIGIFNISADDKIIMLFPNDQEKNNELKKGGSLIFPEKNSKMELIVQILPGRKRDTEAFLVVAVDKSFPKNIIDIFPPNTPFDFTAFWGKYVELAELSEDIILPYEVVNEK
jgi:hypothetical protein